MHDVRTCSLNEQAPHPLQKHQHISNEKIRHTKLSASKIKLSFLKRVISGDSVPSCEDREEATRPGRG